MQKGIKKTPTFSKTLRTTFAVIIFVLVNELVKINNAVCKAIAEEGRHTTDDVKTFFTAMLHQPTRERFAAETGTSYDALTKISEALVADGTISLKDEVNISKEDMLRIGTTVCRHLVTNKQVRLAIRKSAKVIGKNARVYSLTVLTITQSWKKANKSPNFTKALLASVETVQN